MKLEIPDKDLAHIVVCLSLGTLYAIRRGIIPAVVGVWTLGMPRFWKPLHESKVLSQSIIDVLKESDELSALQKLAPEKFNPAVDRLIGILLKELARSSDIGWQITWENDEP